MRMEDFLHYKQYLFEPYKHDSWCYFTFDTHWDILTTERILKGLQLE